LALYWQSIIEEVFVGKAPSKRVQKNHPENQIIGDKEVGVETRRKT
jgi:hypothetical protein